MTRFSTWGAYLLLVPQRRALTVFETGCSFATLGTYFFFDKQPNVQNKLEEEIIHLKELCTHMDIIVEKLRRRPLLFYCGITYVSPLIHTLMALFL